MIRRRRQGVHNLFHRRRLLAVAQDQGAFQSFVITFGVDHAILVTALAEPFQHSRDQAGFATAGRARDQKSAAVWRKRHVDVRVVGTRAE